MKWSQIVLRVLDQSFDAMLLYFLVFCRKSRLDLFLD